METREGLIELVIKALQERVYETSKEKGFHDSDDDDSIEKAFMRAALIHTEVSEIIEELRLHEVDWDKVADECADVVIRVLDFAEVHRIDLGDAILAKMAKNQARPHKHGKAF